MMRGVILGSARGWIDRWRVGWLDVAVEVVVAVLVALMLT
jgi:hypothetical protein